MSSLKNKIKKNLPFLSILLIVLNLVFFFSTNYKTSIDEDKIVKIFSEDKSILPRILDKLEIIEEQNNIKNIAFYYKDLVKNDNLFLGNKNGKEIIIEFFDYNCGYCKRSFPEIMELVSENKDIKIILKTPFAIFSKKIRGL